MTEAEMAVRRALEEAENACLDVDDPKFWVLALKIRALLDGIPRMAILE